MLNPNLCLAVTGAINIFNIFHIKKKWKLINWTFLLWLSFAPTLAYCLEKLKNINQTHDREFKMTRCFILRGIGHSSNHMEKRSRNVFCCSGCLILHRRQRQQSLVNADPILKRTHSPKQYVNLRVGFWSLWLACLPLPEGPLTLGGSVQFQNLWLGLVLLVFC